MISELIGYIDPNKSERQLTFKNSDEIFYVMRCKLRGIELDILISSYVYNGDKGCVKITGSYCTVTSKDSEDKTIHIPYIYAQDITSVPEDTPLTNEVKFKFRLTKVHKYLVTCNGLELLFAYGTVVNSFGNIEVYKVCLKGALARRYKNSAKGTEFTASAFLKGYGKGVEFLINEILE